MYDSEFDLKYYVYFDNACNCAYKCLRRKLGLTFNICDINKNLIASIKGRKNNDFGAFFDDSYSYEINFPPDATPDLKLTLLHCVYSHDTLWLY